MVFVSHDRYFIDKLATRVFEVADGAVQVYPGNYEDYLWRKEGKELVAPAPEPEDKAPAADLEARPPAAAARSEKRLNPIKLRHMKERQGAIEDEVTRLEVEIADYEQALADFRSAEESIRLSELLAARRADLDALLAEWEEVAQVIEANR